ncbi:MAG TPA: hypothetical protein VGM68_12660 [Rhizomicrobium sp.]
MNMTLVMVWKELGIERFWMVSDSRLSASGYSGPQRLTDRAAKILEAPLILRDSTVGKAVGTPGRSTILGFAYAGSSLIALQAYAAVLPLWSRLEIAGPQVLPSIQDCARHLSKFVEGYFREAESACQCVLIGYDDSSGVLDGWLIEASVLENKAVVTTRQLQLRGPDEIEIFGTGKTDALATLENYARHRAAPHWRREPLEMIRQNLKHDREGTVGGGVQLGVLTEAGFELSYDVQPLRVGDPVGQPLVKMKYRGFDLHDISKVGDAQVILTGIAG